MAQSSRVDVAMRPDYEGVLLALSGKTKLILVILANLQKEKAFSRSIASYQGSGDVLISSSKYRTSGKQLSPSGEVYKSPQSFSKMHPVSAQPKQGN